MASSATTTASSPDTRAPISARYPVVELLTTAGFSVAGDGVSLVDTGTMGVRTLAKSLNVDITGVRTLTLKVSDGGDGTRNDHASWGDARVHC